MKTEQPPYPNREAVPLYFYPFLSPLTCTATAPDIQRFCSGLQTSRTKSGRTLLYIHIPYCKNICYFCGFYHDIARENSDVLTRYVRTLKEEIRQYAGNNYIRQTPITAVYFGGGTPSLLTPRLTQELFESVRKHFSIAEGTEITFEGEVRTLKDVERINLLRDQGCTRVSFGVQSFNDRVRKLSGIVASQEDISECINNTQRAGYAINLDLMYGLPGQSFEIWKEDIQKAINLGCSNIDIYDTVLYPHTTLFRIRHKIKNELPTTPKKMQMLAYAIDALSAAGYTQSTVEDFASSSGGYRMKKLVYGGGDGRSELIALGASAVGLINGFSYRNLPPDEYMAWSPEKRQLPVQLLYPLTEEDFDKRAVVFFPKVLGLRKKDISPERLLTYRPVFDDFIRKGLVTESEDEFKPTKKGLLWTDNMAMDFLQPREQHKIWKIGH